MGYETVIGLEVHVELLTQSKLFCACANRFGAEPNTLCCPTCLGLPGGLPVLNQSAVDLAIRAALALNCQIAPIVHFDRKNYFYPDLPKGYQITQWSTPLGTDGFLEIGTADGAKKVGIARVHLEDDAGKLIHTSSETAAASLVDYNRSGVPLIEIVTRPDLSSPQEARAFLEGLKTTLHYLNVSDCKMEQGSLRCDANLSIRHRGAGESGVKTELKNVNSFRNIERGLEFERLRQLKVIEDGGVVLAETRRWDDALGRTVPMRSKEQADDYRYFSEPDLPLVEISPEWVEQVRSTLPELPHTRHRRLVRDYSLTDYEAQMITRSRALADLYESVVRCGAPPKAASNWLLGEVSRLKNVHQMEWEEMPISACDLARLLNKVTSGDLSATVAKRILTESLASGRSVGSVMDEHSAVPIMDDAELRLMIAQVIAANPKVVAELRAGKDRVLMFLIGQVMRASRGQANAAQVTELLRDELGLR